MWAKRKVEVIPVVVGGLRAIPRGLKKSLENIHCIRVIEKNTCRIPHYYELQEYCGEFLRFERWPDPCDPWL